MADSDLPGPDVEEVIETSSVRKFRPRLIVSEDIVEAEEDAEHTEDMLEFVRALAEDITEKRLVGFITILVFPDGTQSEVSLLQEPDTSVLGRLHVSAANILETVMYGDESDE